MIIKFVIKHLQSVRVFVIIFITVAFSAKADHYYGGSIIYNHIGGYKYKVTVITYADNSLENSDRDSVEIIWGDGAKEFIQRVKNFGNGETVFPGIKKNIYEGTHEYSEFGNYKLVFIDNYRPHDVLNIEGNNANHTLLYFDAIIPVEDSATFCKNNSPRFLTEPYMNCSPGEDFFITFTHYDIDGDSLFFKLIKPKEKNASPITDYYFPDNVSIDSITGLFKWQNTPSYSSKEIYVFAYEIEEYREGQLIGVSIVDFPVIFEEENKPKGHFSDLSGLMNEGHYHFDGSEVIDLVIDYENPDADSVYIDVFTGLQYNSHFNLTNYASSNGIKAFDTLKINYLGNDNGQGNHIITFRAGNIYGFDTVFDYHSVSLSTSSDTSWSCSIPPDIRDVEDIVPSVPVFDIAPNLFSESVWVNLGENYQNMSIQIFDMRGCLVGRKKNPTSKIFKIPLENLRAGMYFFVINRGNEVLTVLKSVKK